MTGLRPGPDTLETTVLAGYEYGRGLTVLQMAEASAIMNTISRTVGAFFQDYDVLLTPTTNTPPLPVEYLDANAAGMGHEEWTRRSARAGLDIGVLGFDHPYIGSGLAPQQRRTACSPWLVSG